ncbi:MAG TPA: Sec-independent protein translocase protein TatB [Ramlibacter sp.]|nr:Sec-independent protein translocase protein TatB [Ramlibacter sp.]
MIDLGIEKMMVIGAVALIVIGPEKLPRVARTVGTLIGKAQRYVADVKDEVNRSIELEELKKMKQEVETAARDVETSIHTGVREIESELNSAAQGISSAIDGSTPQLEAPAMIVYPEYRNPRKNWRIKQGATPQWYKARNGVRTKALSGAARVARYRPQKFN